MTTCSGSLIAAVTRSYRRIRAGRWKQLFAQHRRHLPGGRALPTDFRFKMRVWFLKETKSICHELRDGVQYSHRNSRGRHLSPNAARERSG